ncbi:MAG TPA: glycosyltransferase [Gemmataceae bacterium]|nr:glycosyltransferase [Gemmataceae bacterium]
MMNVVHLTSSRFYGGPERQMLGLALALPGEYRSVFISFAEEGHCHAFLDMVRRHGFEALALRHDTPRLVAAWGELCGELRRRQADILCCHGYKANLVGRPAARRVGIPVIAVSRGWTGEGFRVRLYDALDRINLRWMDHVVCVSEAQAAKVLRAGVPAKRVTVIRNAISVERFATADPAAREALQALFRSPRRRIIGAAGRLSPDKGFDVLVEAAGRLVPQDGALGFVLFGEGPMRSELARRITAAGLEGIFVLAGFRDDLDRFLPFFDLFVLPSYGEGLPNVVLEAFAAKVPVVATAVGGTPELLDDGRSGYLVPPGDPIRLAERIRDALACEARRREMGLHGYRRVRKDFTFAAQSEQYQRLFHDLIRPTANRPAQPEREIPCPSLR